MKLKRLSLLSVGFSANTRFAYDGVNALAEYNGSNALQLRYVFGPGIDNVIVQYEGTGTTDRRFMGKDERGSIISITDSSGALLNINRYDEYGKPQSTNAGRFQYTGQMWLSELGAYYYKTRVYLPHLGIFAQTDPAGYDGDGPNLYAYVLNDPVNFTDPLGLAADDIVIVGQRPIVITGSRSAGVPLPMDVPSPPVTVPSSQAACIECEGTDGSDIVIVGQRPQPQPQPEPPINVRAPRIVPLPAAPARPPIFIQAAAPQEQDFCGSEGHDVPEGNWSEACALHDRCYGTPGSIKEVCDVVLMLNITAACTEKTMLPALCALPGVIYGVGLIGSGLIPGLDPSRDAFNRAQRR